MRSSLLLLSFGYHRCFRVWLEFKPADLWIGASWNPAPAAIYKEPGLHIWICILPMFPIHVMIFRPIEGWVKELRKKLRRERSW